MRLPVKDLPRRWLKVEWVNTFSLNYGAEGGNEAIVTDKIIEKAEFFLWLKRTKYPHLTPDQYRTAVKRLVTNKGPGYSNKDSIKLYPGLQDKLQQTILSHGRGQWGFKAHLSRLKDEYKKKRSAKSKSNHSVLILKTKPAQQDSQSKTSKLQNNYPPPQPPIIPNDTTQLVNEGQSKKGPIQTVPLSAWYQQQNEHSGLKNEKPYGFDSTFKEFQINKHELVNKILVKPIADAHSSEDDKASFASDDESNPEEALKNIGRAKTLTEDILLTLPWDDSIEYRPKKQARGCGDVGTLHTETDNMFTSSDAEEPLPNRMLEHETKEATFRGFNSIMSEFHNRLWTNFYGKTGQEKNAKEFALKRENYVKKYLNNEDVSFFAVVYDHTLDFGGMRYIYCNSAFIKLLGEDRTQAEWNILSVEDVLRVSNSLKEITNKGGIIRFDMVGMQPYSNLDPMVYANLTMEFVPDFGIFGFFTPCNCRPNTKHFSVEANSAILPKETIRPHRPSTAPLHIVLLSQKLHNLISQENVDDMQLFDLTFIQSVLIDELTKRGEEVGGDVNSDKEQTVKPEKKRLSRIKLRSKNKESWKDIAFEAAYSKIRKAIRWRHIVKLNQIDIYSGRLFEVASAENYIYWYGYDYYGQPIIWYRASVVDLFKLRRDYHVDVDYAAYMMNWGLKRFLPPGVSKCVIICDCSDLGFKNTNPRCVIGTTKLLNHGFFRRVDKLIILPVLPFTLALWKMIRSVSSRSLKEKFHLLKTANKQYLSDIFDVDQYLPDYFGGPAKHPTEKFDLQEQEAIQTKLMEEYVGRRNQSRTASKSGSDLSDLQFQQEQNDSSSENGNNISLVTVTVREAALAQFRLGLRDCLDGRTMMPDHAFIQLAKKKEDESQVQFRGNVCFVAFRYNFDVLFGEFRCLFCNDRFIHVMGADRTKSQWCLFVEEEQERLGGVFQAHARSLAKLNTTLYRPLKIKIGKTRLNTFESMVVVDLSIEICPGVGIFMCFTELVKNGEESARKHRGLIQGVQMLREQFQTQLGMELRFPDDYIEHVLRKEHELACSNQSLTEIDIAFENSFSRIREARAKVKALLIEHPVHYYLNELKNAGHIYWLGHDYFDRPILWIRFCKMVEAKECFAWDLQLLVFLVECGQQYLLRNSSAIQFVLMIDVQNDTHYNFGARIMIDIMEHLHGCFPHLLAKAYIAPADERVQTIWEELQTHPEFPRYHLRKFQLLPSFNIEEITFQMDFKELFPTELGGESKLHSTQRTNDFKLMMEAYQTNNSIVK